MFFHNGDFQKSPQVIPTLGSTFLDDPNRCPLAVGFLWPRGSNKNSDLNCLKPEHLKNEAFKDVFEVLFYWVPAHVWVPALNFRDVSGLAHQQMRFFNHFHSERWPKWDWPVTTKPIRDHDRDRNNSWFLLGPLFQDSSMFVLWTVKMFPAYLGWPY
jgi:hypothetical protein